MARPDSESAYVYGAFAKSCQDHGNRVCPSASDLKEMNWQAENFSEVFVHVRLTHFKPSVCMISIGLYVCFMQLFRRIAHFAVH